MISKAIVNSMLIISAILMTEGVIFCRTAIYREEWKMGFVFWVTGTVISLIAAIISINTTKRSF